VSKQFGCPIVLVGFIIRGIPSQVPRVKPRYCFHWYAVGGFGHLQICPGSVDDACRVVLFLVAEVDCQITASVLGEWRYLYHLWLQVN